MGLSERLPGRWLPEEVDDDGDGRPIRPDLPWLRNLSWTKAHAMQIGFGTGLLVYWSQTLGADALGFAVATIVFLTALGVWSKLSDRTVCGHGLGVHDLKEKPWYGVSAAVATWALAWLVAWLV